MSRERVTWPQVIIIETDWLKYPRITELIYYFTESNRIQLKINCQSQISDKKLFPQLKNEVWVWNSCSINRKRYIHWKITCMYTKQQNFIKRIGYCNNKVHISVYLQYIYFKYAVLYIHVVCLADAQKTERHLENNDTQ